MAPRPRAKVRRRVKPFTPSKEVASSAQGAANLVARTVGREDLLDLIHERFRTVAESRNRPHTLLIGPRGAGKTHVVEVALHRLREDHALVQQLAVVRLDEDAMGITRYEDVLQAVVEQLGDGPPKGFRAAPRAAEEDVRKLLYGRVLVLVIENLDRVFASIGTKGQQELRAWVETSRQVLLLATTPMLFSGVQDRSLPWFGGFSVEYLAELSPEQGLDLLIQVAESDGDAELAEYLRSDTGRARVQAMSRLTGGSPRIWMILSETLTIESLDELMPAVDDLLEGLVPHYQQLLWTLGGNEERIITVMAKSELEAATVREIAEVAGLEQRVVASTLGRLAELRWVRAEKVPGTDQRTTWYRLREPMLRHHFQHRGASRGALELIVEVLKIFYDPQARRRHLAPADSGSQTERALLDSMQGEVFRFDSGYADRDPDELLADARLWAEGRSPGRTPEAGVLVEVCVLAARGDLAGAERRLASEQEDVRSAGRAVIDQAGPVAGVGTDSELVRSRVADGLAVAAASTVGKTSIVIGLVSTGWDARWNPQAAADRLASLAVGLDSGGELLLDLRQERAFWLAQAHELVLAARELEDVVRDREATHSGDHPDTLIARHNLACIYWSTGRRPEAVSLLHALHEDAVRLFGENHPASKTAVANLARALVDFGDGDRDGTGTEGVLESFMGAVKGLPEAQARLPVELLEVARCAKGRSTAGSRIPAPSGITL